MISSIVVNTEDNSKYHGGFENFYRGEVKIINVDLLRNRSLIIEVHHDKEISMSEVQKDMQLQLDIFLYGLLED